MTEITLNGETISISCAKFKKWIELEEIREKLFGAVERGDINEVADLILLYLSNALSIDISILETVPWKETATAFSVVTMINGNIKLLPFMKFSKKHGDIEKEVWDYPGRLWYSYANKIADKYHWVLEYIADLDVNDAFALIQEILVSDQIDKEWDWALSDKSVSYDSATKTSKYIELPRPDWMKPVPKPPQKVKIPKFMLPVGNIVRYTTKQDATA